MQVALWTMSYLMTYVEICEDEEEAAEFAFSVQRGDHAVVSGVQFEDGRLIAREDFKTWPAYARHVEEHKRRRAATPPPDPTPPVPVKEITNPFGDNSGRAVYTTNVPKDYPDWVGK